MQHLEPVLPEDALLTVYYLGCVFFMYVPPLQIMLSVANLSFLVTWAVFFPRVHGKRQERRNFLYIKGWRLFEQRKQDLWLDSRWVNLCLYQVPFTCWFYILNNKIHTHLEFLKMRFLFKRYPFQQTWSWQLPKAGKTASMCTKMPSTKSSRDIS